MEHILYINGISVPGKKRLSQEVYVAGNATIGQDNHWRSLVCAGNVHLHREQYLIVGCTRMVAFRLNPNVNSAFAPAVGRLSPYQTPVLSEGSMVFPSSWENGTGRSGGKDGLSRFRSCGSLPAPQT